MSTNNMKISKPIKIMIVDDHVFIRDGLRRLLEQYSSYEVVGEAIDGNEAYQKYDLYEPDIIIMDLSMPGMGGLEAIAKLIKHKQKVKILVLSMHNSITYAIRSLDLGAKAYVNKSSVVDELVKGLEAIATGQVYLSEKIAKRIASNDVYGSKDLLKELSTKEFEIFRLLAEGFDLEAIGSSLNLSGKSIANYQSSIKRKLNVTSPVELVRYAILEGIIQG